MLPPCYQPTGTVGHLLARVHEGYDVRHEEMIPLMDAGLIELHIGPTARSGYELTSDGEDALGRYVYRMLAGAPRG